MQECNEDEWSDEEVMSLVQTLTKHAEVSAEELQTLLSLRQKKRVDFVLVDIREVYEYTESSISGTNLLLPMSTIHLHMDQLKKLSHKLLIFYCHTGGRTSQMIFILCRMGFTNIAHVEGGIHVFYGKKLKNAPLPKNIQL